MNTNKIVCFFSFIWLNPACDLSLSLDLERWIIFSKSSQKNAALDKVLTIWSNVQAVKSQNVKEYHFGMINFHWGQVLRSQRLNQFSAKMCIPK